LPFNLNRVCYVTPFCQYYKKKWKNYKKIINVKFEDLISRPLFRLRCKGYLVHDQLLTNERANRCNCNPCLVFNIDNPRPDFRRALYFTVHDYIRAFYGTWLRLPGAFSGSCYFSGIFCLVMRALCSSFWLMRISSSRKNKKYFHEYKI